MLKKCEKNTKKSKKSKKSKKLKNRKNVKKWQKNPEIGRFSGLFIGPPLKTDLIPGGRK